MSIFLHTHDACTLSQASFFMIKWKVSDRISIFNSYYLIGKWLGVLCYIEISCLVIKNSALSRHALTPTILQGTINYFSRKDLMEFNGHSTPHLEYTIKIQEQKIIIN